ncbi:TPA: hypothetical protein WGQ62_002000, partial [Neisseria meningitidis]
HANSKEAFVARKMQSDLQKKLNASNYNKQQYARQAVTALENASKAENKGNIAFYLN